MNVIHLKGKVWEFCVKIIWNCVLCHVLLTCECIRGISSGCIRFGNINNAALFEQSICHWCCEDVFVASVAVFAEHATLGDDSVEIGSICEFGDVCIDDERKPGGGSTPSAISNARCKRAFLSQSSIG